MAKRLAPGLAFAVAIGIEYGRRQLIAQTVVKPLHDLAGIAPHLDFAGRHLSGKKKILPMKGSFTNRGFFAVGDIEHAVIAVAEA